MSSSQLPEKQAASAICECPCHHGKGTPGEGYSWVWDDDRGIRHEDWANCKCEDPDPLTCRTEVYETIPEARRA